MRKIIASIVLALATLTGVLASTGSAEAATDHRKCVTPGEYRAVTKNMSRTRVISILDGRGTYRTDQTYGYYEGEWVEDGYWDSYYDYDLDEWVDEWVDASYWDDYANWREIRDMVRTYRRCGGGYMSINFDNYTDGRTRMHVYKKDKSNGWAMASWIDNIYDDLWYYDDYGVYSRSAQPQSPPAPESDEKPMPGTERPAKPESEPTTPAPAH